MKTELSPKAAEIARYTRSLLANGGYNGFSYADISTQVGISKASIHHHFPSKAELVQRVVADYRAEARDALAMLDRQLADDAPAQLRAYADFWAQCIRDGSLPFCICAMLAAEMPAIPGEVATEVRAHFDELATWLASVLDKGAGRGQFELHGDANAAAKSFMATVHGAMLAARALADPAIFPAIVQPAIQLLARTA